MKFAFYCSRIKNLGGEENHLFSKCNARAASEAPTSFHSEGDSWVRDESDVSCQIPGDSICHLILVWFAFLPFLVSSELTINESR